MMTLTQHIGNHLFHDADITQLFLYWTGMILHWPICYSIPALWRAEFLCPPFKIIFSLLPFIEGQRLIFEKQF